MLLPVLLSYGGFTALCLSMDRHHRDLLARTPTARVRRVLQLCGWSLLGLSLAAAVLATGWSLGLVEWCAALMASAMLLVWLLPYRPRLVMLMAAFGLLFSPLVALALG